MIRVIEAVNPRSRSLWAGNGEWARQNTLSLSHWQGKMEEYDGKLGHGKEEGRELTGRPHPEQASPSP